MKYEIKSWIDGTILYQAEAESFKALVEAAVKARANLRSANLSGANLSGADLSGAYLSGANLIGADLSGANLIGANLIGANLSGANLIGADLSGANLIGADLIGANLIGADLGGANLSGANLIGANLSGANLPAPTMVLLASWGILSPKLTTEMMKYDAFFHPNPKTFAKWVKGGPCPYSGVKIQRAANFTENKKLWKKGTPKSGYALMVAVLREKTKTDL